MSAVTRSALGRRRFGGLALGVAFGALFVASPAYAGSYLERAAALLDAAELEARSLGKRFSDRELAAVLHRIAVERLAAARQMQVPKEVVKAHPHLLLVLEGFERAADAARAGKLEPFLLALARAREERRTFEMVLKELGWTLPK